MTGLMAVLYYVLWMVALLLMYVGHRVPLMLIGKKAANYWSRGNSTDDIGFVVRASHAHANAVENLPLFAAVVFAAMLMDRAAVVDSLACWVVYARVAQSVMHLLGTSIVLVLARASFFLVQIGLIVYMAVQLIQPVAVAAG